MKNRAIFLVTFIVLALASIAAFAGSLRDNTDQQFLNAQASRNYVKNSGAEKNDLNVTDASGIHTRSTSSPIEGDASHAIDATADDQIVCFQADDFQTALLGGSCEISFKYNGDASLYKAYATMAGVTVSDSVNNQLSNISSGSQTFTATFPCGASTTDDPLVCIESTSASAAAIKVDRVRIGENTNIGSVAQAQAVLYAHRNASNITGVNPNASFVKIAFNSVASPGFDQYSAFNTSTNRYVAPTAGRYQINSSISIQSANVLAARYFLTAYVNGAEACRGEDSVAIVSTIISKSVTCTLNLNQSDYVEIYLYGSGNNSASTLTVEGAVNTTYFNLQRFPTASETVARLDAPGVGWTAFTPTGSWTTNTTWTGWYQCSMNTLRVTAKAATAGAPTSATFGVDLPSGFIIDSTKLDPTANFGVINGQVAINDSSATGYKAYPLYSSTTRVVAAYQSATSGLGALVNQAAPITFGSGDSVGISFQVPVTDASPCPKSPKVLIPGSVYSSSAGVERVERASVSTSCTSTPCTIASGTPGITSISRGSTGNYTVNFATGNFSAAPVCNFTPSATTPGTALTCRKGAPTATTYPFDCVTGTPSAVDTAFDVSCVGPR